MPFIGSQPAEVALTTGDLGDDIVTLAKLASGTDGELLTWDASGNPATVSAGSSGHYLKSQGAGSVPVFAAVADPTLDYEYVSVATGSGESELSFTNMASGYDYIYVGDTMTVDSDAVWMKAQIGVAGSPPAYRSSGYLGTKWGVNNAGNSTSSERTYDFPLVAGDDEGMGTGTNEGVRAFECTLYNPANASTMTAFLGEAVNYGSTPNLIGTKAAGLYPTAEANTCVRFNTSGGTLTGTIYQFRRKRS
jgi:hypothetical protein